MTSLRTLDLMSYREKTLHWMGPEPWRPGGARVRFNRPTRSFRAMAEDGHVEHMPLLIGRPCYGIITAFLRYKDALKPVRGKGLLPDSRCHDCILRESCGRLVRERIEASPTLKSAHDEWLKTDGPSKFVRPEPDFDDTHVGRQWKRLGLAAADAGFTSCNDAAVAEHYETLDRKALENDRRRKAAKRERDRKAGKIDDGHRADLHRAAEQRHLDITLVKIAPRPPREIDKLPWESIEDLRNVWLGREVLRAQRVKCRAPDIARWIQASGLRNISSTFAALCTRVSKDLQRIEKFERLTWNGGPLLKPFDPSTEYSKVHSATP